jgi:hypothetical protein
MLVQLDAFEKEYDKEIKVKSFRKKGHRALYIKLRALYKEIGDYAYAQQYLEAKHTNKELIKKRWGEEVEKKRSTTVILFSS